MKLAVVQQHCDPSAYIVFPGDPDALLSRLDRERPAFFGAIPRADQRPLRGSRAAIRWLSWAQPRGARGELPIGFSVDPAGGAIERPMPSARTTPSRLETGMRADLQAMVVIVDVTGLTGISYRSLADYLSMVVLGNVRQDHRPTALPSVLGLFDADGRTAGAGSMELTDWDLSYLESLYSGTWNMPAGQRIGVIRAAMRRLFD